MPRRLRVATGGLVYHVLNRAVGRGRIFDDEADYQAMERVIERTVGLVPMRIVSYCLMPNHWHMVLWPREDGQLSGFMRMLTVTHTQRWHAHHHSAGTGPLYQGRFKSFPIQQGDHFLAVCRYVERNARRANLVESARNWPWGSLAKRSLKVPPRWLLPMDRWPVESPGNWSGHVTLKPGHRLLRTGPYALVRHPIYTGLLLAMTGTAVAVDRGRGVLAVLIAVETLWRKLRLEERWLTEEFGAEYGRYRREVKALVPGVV